MRNLLWLILGFVLASSAVSCVYRLGYLHGEIAAMESPTVGSRVPRDRCPGKCGHAGRVTLPATGLNGVSDESEVAR